MGWKTIRRLATLITLVWAAGAYRRYRLAHAPEPSWEL
jgi:hypothetical protein